MWGPSLAIMASGAHELNAFKANDRYDDGSSRAGHLASADRGMQLHEQRMQTCTCPHMRGGTSSVCYSSVMKKSTSNGDCTATRRPRRVNISCGGRPKSKDATVHCSKENSNQHARMRWRGMASRLKQPINACAAGCCVHLRAAEGPASSRPQAPICCSSRVVILVASTLNKAPPAASCAANYQLHHVLKRV